ncbi:hypothetical protein GUJ93_ZPchr0007g5899 [Zizania palustris]|uniref:Uncharacterized protein n=1 Tax=Zizania palustris TaxID=103762 RepID=A0A8J5STU7_ZIZPA|nr:hypothetical protein GUJ93_ZPchr0007g5899 [Zizania palustris]
MDCCHLVLSVAIVVVVLLVPRAGGYPWPLCGDSGSNFSARSKYLANINLTGATLPSNASSSPELFATAAGVGSVPDQVSALALCRGDANASLCLTCLTQAFRALPNACAYSKDATVFYESCQLSYSNASIFPVVVSGKIEKYMFGSYTNVTKEPARFNRVVAALVNATANYAAYNSTRRYASGEADFNQEYPKVYSWAQCTPDLTPARCRGCLTQIIADSIGLFESRIWAGTLAVRCSFRYNTLPFLNGSMKVQLLGPPARSGSPAPAPAPAATPTASTVTAAGEKKKKTTAGLYIGLPSSIVVLFILLVLAFVRFKRRTKAIEIEHPLRKITRAQCTIFDLPTLQEATENFSKNKKLGEGGFGTVYKVRILSASRGDNTCYEYIKNGSLDNFLFDTRSRNALNWKQQYNIILGIAKGIVYLHEDSALRIIHRDLKANNILLDENMDPKIADFGLARLLGEDHTQTRTARVVGTLGYMPPEYLAGGRVSTKIDIFSFGVLVLEIVTRRSNCSYDDHDSVNLLTDVWNCWTKGTVSQMIDQSLDEYSQSQAQRCIQIGLLCVQPDPGNRPHISSVIFMLSRENMDLQQPSQPAFYFGREATSSSPSCGQRSYVYDRSGLPGISVNGVTLTEIYPR